MSTIAEQVGYRIRKAREAKDFNQQDMAKKLDLTPGAFAKIERGETDPSITRLHEIAQILKIDIISLIKDALPPKESPVTRAEFNSMHAQMDSLKKEFKTVVTQFTLLKNAQPVQEPVIKTRKRKAKA